MTESPEILQDHDGRWIRRDILEDEIDYKGKKKEFEDVVDEMVEEGTLRSKYVGEQEYLQLKSRWEAIKTLANSYGEQTKDRINGIMGRK